jgi:hypothetical protein
MLRVLVARPVGVLSKSEGVVLRVLVEDIGGCIGAVLGSFLRRGEHEVNGK